MASVISENLFDYHTDYILEDDIVLLRPLQAEDYPMLLTYALYEPDIWQFNAGGAGGTEQLETYISYALKQRRLEREYPFVVLDKRTNAYAGCTRFYDIQPEKQTIQIGFTWYGKAYQGTGINKHCKYLLLSFAFDRLGMERVGFGANLKNERSINAMKSIGCTAEGVLRNNGFDAAGNRIDSILLSILKQEWQVGIKEKLQQVLTK